MKHILPTLLTAAMTLGVASLAAPTDTVFRIDSPQPHEVFQRQSETSGVIRVSGSAPAGPVEVRVDEGKWQPIASRLYFLSIPFRIQFRGQ